MSTRLWRLRSSWRMARRFALYELPIIWSWVRAWWHCMKGHEIIDWGDGWNCETCQMDLEIGKAWPKPQSLEAGPVKYD